MKTTTIISLLIAVAAILVWQYIGTPSVIGFFSKPPSPTRPTTTPSKQISVNARDYFPDGKISRTEWNHSRSRLELTQAIAEKRVPVILTDSPAVREWRAANWTPDYLFEVLLNVYPVYRHETPEWMYEFPGKPIGGTNNGHPVEDHPRVLKELPKLGVDTFFRGFIRYPAPGKKHVWLSSMGPLSYGGTPFTVLDPECMPREYLSPAKNSENPNMWLLPAGSVVHTHFDSGHNFFFLSFGEQRLTLWPPGAYKHLYPYPHLHARDRQSQTDSTTSGRTSSTNNGVDYAQIFPGGSESISPQLGVTTTLRKGEMVYIPPFWWYRLESIHPSAAVNVWSQDFEDVIAKYLWVTGVPTAITTPIGPEVLVDATASANPAAGVRDALGGQKRQEADLQLALLGKYLKALVDKVLTLQGVENPSDYLTRNLIDIRYRFFLPDFNCDLPRTFSCLLPSDPAHHGQVSKEVWEKIEREELERAVKLFTILNQLNPGAVDMVLFNLVERVTAHVVGMKEICSYWRCIFPTSTTSQNQEKQ